jgi:L-fuculose-phosphate aldolase
LAAVGRAVLERERDRVAAAARRLAALGLVVGTSGNLSLRADDLVAVTPTGAALERLTKDDVAVVDLEGDHVEGPLAATSELALHLGVYHRYHAGAVVHTHSPLATALACVIEHEVPVVHYHMLALGGSIRVAPYATFGTPELAEATLEALHDRTAALMANHGAIVHAGDLDTAVEHAQLVEWACGVYWHAAAIGRPRALDEDQQAAVVEAVVSRGYGQTREVAR